MDTSHASISMAYNTIELESPLHGNLHDTKTEDIIFLMFLKGHAREGRYHQLEYEIIVAMIPTMMMMRSLTNESLHKTHIMQ